MSRPEVPPLSSRYPAILSAATRTTIPLFRHARSEANERADRPGYSNLARQVAARHGGNLGGVQTWCRITAMKPTLSGVLEQPASSRWLPSVPARAAGTSDASS